MLVLRTHLESETARVVGWRADTALPVSRGRPEEKDDNTVDQAQDMVR